MTRSITIVNTSNWDGEDYLIGIPGVEGQVRMRPGESVEFTPRRSRSWKARRCPMHASLWNSTRLRKKRPCRSIRTRWWKSFLRGRR